jgi:ABC-type arginine transport system permease subunit
MTLIKNPSSQYPYTINFTLGYSDNTASPTFSNTLTVRDLTTSLISLVNYSNIVNNTTTASWLINFNYYFDSTTILQF